MTGCLGAVLSVHLAGRRGGDIANRRAVIVIAVLWQAPAQHCSPWGVDQVIDPNLVLVCIFMLGLRVAFTRPCGAPSSDIASKEELASAITLGGAAESLRNCRSRSGRSPAAAAGRPVLISLNVSMFLLVALAVSQWKQHQEQSAGLLESFTESFISSLRYARHSHGMRIVLFRNLLFSLVISIVPALFPVIALKEINLSAAQLGLVFTCLALGSLVGAVFVLSFLRARTSQNAITSVSMAIMLVVLVTLAFLRQLPALMLCALLAGVAWSLAGSELWVAGQRVIPGWVRGRMNAFQIMVGQGGIALGALMWGWAVVEAGYNLTFSAAAVLALAVLAIGHRVSKTLRPRRASTRTAQ
jgi:hypothetical protein